MTSSDMDNIYAIIESISKEEKERARKYVENNPDDKRFRNSLRDAYISATIEVLSRIKDYARTQIKKEGQK